jgi:hypothetical protein
VEHLLGVKCWLLRLQEPVALRLQHNVLSMLKKYKSL